MESPQSIQEPSMVELAIPKGHKFIDGSGELYATAARNIYTNELIRPDQFEWPKIPPVTRKAMPRWFLDEARSFFQFGSPSPTH